MAFTDAPVVGADVRVEDSEGRRVVDFEAATNDQGFFRPTYGAGALSGSPSQAERQTAMRSPGI